MATDMKRFSLTVTPEMEQTLDELKRKEFYNRPYAEMYRHILSAGIAAVKKDTEQEKEISETMTE